MDNNLAPYNKVVAATLGAAFGSILAYVLNSAGLDVTPIEDSIVVLCTFALGYLVPERPSVGGQLLNRAKRT